MLDAADVHVAQRLAALAGEADEPVALAVALAVRRSAAGLVCVDLATVADAAGGVEELALAGPRGLSWRADRSAARCARRAPPVLRLVDGRLLYLDRYWREERQVAADLQALAAPAPRRSTRPPPCDRARPAASPTRRTTSSAPPRAVALSRQGSTVLAGGPGTGKTTTVARMLALLAEQAERPAARRRGSRWRRRPARPRPGWRRRCTRRSPSST